MRLLLDQNISWILCERLKNIFPEIDHVKSLMLQTSADDVVWEFAKNNSFTIVTKDSDFNKKLL